MSEQEVNSYRLTSLEEPTDEMLSYIMKEVAEDAKSSNIEAEKLYFREIETMYKKKYGKAI
ncbi:MAG: hypothetical protein J5708_05350 [Bacteroidales bacterium]|nr:hypothetical protein [Bacteroidales bacterium]